jgi:CheY-like chemotaxis protein
VARVAALIPDLLFGSKAAELLRASGHEVRLASRPPGAEEVGEIDVVVVDLTQDSIDAGAVGVALGEADVRVLGVFSHVEPQVRDRALAAGFDQVVPRSRFMREGGELVARLAAAAENR